MSGNRAPKSGFAAEAQRKVSTYIRTTTSTKTYKCILLRPPSPRTRLMVDNDVYCIYIYIYMPMHINCPWICACHLLDIYYTYTYAKCLQCNFTTHKNTMETRVYFSTGWLLLPQHIRQCVARAAGQLELCWEDRVSYIVHRAKLHFVRCARAQKLNGVVESEYERQISA